jgi:hypothetical protein
MTQSGAVRVQLASEIRCNESLMDSRRAGDSVPDAIVVNIVTVFLQS